MIRLPIDAVLPGLVSLLKTTRVAVLEAPPGAGKSTRVPGAIADAGLTDQRIVMLEPRRLAARSLAARIAYERKGRLGDEVGYHVRHDRKFGAETKIVVMTEGILTRQLQADPLLEGVGAVILDEFHERSIHSDLALAFVKELTEVREDLLVVVMSATLGTESVASYLDAKVVSSQGRLYPLAINYVKRPPDSLEAGVRSAIADLMETEDDGGHILVFLPSAGAIRRVQGALTLPSFDVMPLYGAMRPEDQDRVLASSKRRKVILATNIAETSLTIEGVTAVIDSGLVRRVYASKSSGFDELREERISMASAKQRAGRAGRTAPGRVWRLWTHAEEHRFADYDEPEVRRIDITRPVLDCMAWSGRPATEFAWFEPPRVDQMQRAQSLLCELGALNEHRLTPLGHRMLKMPLHPRLGAMLDYANANNAGALAAVACAVVSEQDFVTSVSDGAPPVDSDVLVRCQLLESAARSGRSDVRGYQVHQGRARRVLEVAKRLRRLVEPGQHDPEVVLKALAVGFVDRVCFRRASNFAASGGDSVVLGRESRVDAEIFVAVVLFGADRQGNGIVRMASEFDERWLVHVFGERVSSGIEVSWDGDLNRVVARQVKRFGKVKYDERPASLKGADPAAVARLLVDRLIETPQVALGKDATRFVQRLTCAALTRPELAMPHPGATAWRGLLEQVCYGQRGFADIGDAAFIKTIRANLSPEQRRSLEKEFPDRIQVPSGSNMRIDYSEPERPVLAVRIQEVFGWAQTPTLGGGRLKLLMHLLAPSYRPAQITADLGGFWASSYFDVRKDLRARYPKHAWPEDPLNAKPQKKGRSQLD